MSQWYSKELRNGFDALAPTEAIQEAFLPLFAAASCPMDMAVFSRYDSETGNVTVYFSPGAAVLAKMFEAHSCEKPKKEGGLKLVSGDARSTKFFYPSAK